MTDASADSIAQFVDKFLQRTAIGVLLLAVKFALSATVFLVSANASAYLDKLAMVLSVAVLVVLLPTFIRFVRLRKGAHCDWSEPDGYMAEVFRRACVAAFSATFVVLLVLTVIVDKGWTTLPTAFFLNALLAVSLGVLAGTYFYHSRAVDDEFDDDFDEGPGA